MDPQVIETQLQDVRQQINAVVQELVKQSPVAQNLLGRQEVLQGLLDSHANSNGQVSTEEEVLAEVQ
jgi:hypothetical protein